MKRLSTRVRSFAIRNPNLEVTFCDLKIRHSYGKMLQPTLESVMTGVKQKGRPQQAAGMMVDKFGFSLQQRTGISRPSALQRNSPPAREGLCSGNVGGALGRTRTCDLGVTTPPALSS